MFGFVSPTTRNDTAQVVEKCAHLFFCNYGVYRRLTPPNYHDLRQQFTTEIHMADQLKIKPRVLGYEDAATYTNSSKSRIYEMIAKGEFPRPIVISERRRGFLVEDLDKWLDSRPRSFTDGKPCAPTSRHAG